MKLQRGLISPATSSSMPRERAAPEVRHSVKPVFWLNCETSTLFLRMSKSASVPVRPPALSYLAPTSQDLPLSGLTLESISPLECGAMVEMGLSDWL